jgi:hypothetical protein
MSCSSYTPELCGSSTYGYTHGPGGPGSAQANELRLPELRHAHDRGPPNATVPQGEIHGIRCVPGLDNPPVLHGDPLSLEPPDGVSPPTAFERPPLANILQTNAAGRALTRWNRPTAQS